MDSNKKYNFSLADNINCQVQEVGEEKNTVLVMDDVLVEPQALVDYAVQKQVFKNTSNELIQSYYPGLRGKLPAGYINSIRKLVKSMVFDLYAVPRHYQCKISCSFSMITLSTSELVYSNCIPHIDTPKPNMFAAVHYLCGEEHSGTSIYRHKATGLESVGEEDFPAFWKAVKEEEKTFDLSRAAYPTDGMPLYDKVVTIPVKRNRLALYRGNLLHSPDVDSAISIGKDPTANRLTAVLFFEFFDGNANPGTT